MQEYNVILTWEAIYDVADIADYIEAKFGRQRADRFQEDLQKQLNNLRYWGKMFGKTQIFYNNYAVYKKTFSPSIIFYIVEEMKKEIHILRVLREERNWREILSQKRNYTYE